MKLILVMGIIFAVDYLLLFTAGAIGNAEAKGKAYLPCAWMGACFGLAGLLPEAELLRRWGVYAVFLILQSLSVHGITRQSLKRTALYLLLHLSLGKATTVPGSMLSMLLGAVGLALGCLLMRSGGRYVPVELTYRDRCLRLQALRDTGNTLLDPLTGQPVLIVSREVARKLIGLSPAQLEDPVQAIGTVPGLRLIPYRTVGNAGFLLALQLTRVKIGNRQGSTLVAFSPKTLGEHYQALTGGWT